MQSKATKHRSPESTPADDRDVSLDPHDFERLERPPDPPTYNTVHSYEPPGELTDILRLTAVPLWLITELKLQAKDFSTTHGKIAMFCFGRGLPKLTTRKAVSAIREQAEAVMRRAPMDVVEQLKWSYRPTRGTETLFLKRIDAKDVGSCTRYADALGLSCVCLALVAIMAGLFPDLPISPDSKRAIFSELETFLRALKNRVGAVADIHARAMAAPPAEPFEASWAHLPEDE